MTSTERHANHHRLIAERKAAYNPRASRYVRREADKRATWTLRSHLVSEHGHRGLSPFLTYSDLESLHSSDHGADTD